MYLGEKVRQARIAQQISIKELAKLVQVTEAYILNLESGIIQNPSFFTVVRIAKELGLDVYEMDKLYVDPEWLDLIKEARQLGLSRTEIRNFILQQQFLSLDAK
ncbi:helix-turn-helix domain-containing protein [Pseudalkalibacillus sp. Hm43]|uniref:helix-turn-helix domain-containing protein n=1 Tax=Pseudalkalibacillus sp. Hm43 TaxID=3450742 RepID=UPI003F41D460